MIVYLRPPMEVMTRCAFGTSSTLSCLMRATRTSAVGRSCSNSLVSSVRVPSSTCFIFPIIKRLFAYSRFIALLMIVLLISLESASITCNGTNTRGHPGIKNETSNQKGRRHEMFCIAQHTVVYS